MTATIKCRFLGEATGLGDDRKVTGFSILTTPTQVSGPYHQVIASAGKTVDLVSIISGELKALFVKAISSGVYINPFTLTSAIATCGCYISEGDWNYYSYKTTTSVLASFSPESVRAEVELWVVAIT